MNGIGLDCGTATVKLAMLSQERELLWFKSSAHHGAAVQTVRALLGELLQADSNACGYASPQRFVGADRHSSGSGFDNGDFTAFPSQQKGRQY